MQFFQYSFGNVYELDLLPGRFFSGIAVIQQYLMSNGRRDKLPKDLNIA